MRIVTFPNGVNGGAQVLATPFLDISQLTVNSGEQGLLGVAFHPNYASNGYLFVNYSKKRATGSTTDYTVIARYQASPPSSNVTTSSGTVLKIMTQPYTNHNGGAMHFGPDGYLYIAMQ